jgi:hypothetical protein
VGSSIALLSEKGYRKGECRHSPNLLVGDFGEDYLAFPLFHFIVIAERLFCPSFQRLLNSLESGSPAFILDTFG